MFKCGEQSKEIEQLRARVVTIKATYAQEFFDQLKSMEKRADLPQKESNGLMLAYGMLAAIANPITCPAAGETKEEWKLVPSRLTIERREIMITDNMNRNKGYLTTYGSLWQDLFESGPSHPNECSHSYQAVVGGKECRYCADFIPASGGCHGRRTKG